MKPVEEIAREITESVSRCVQTSALRYYFDGVKASELIAEVLRRDRAEQREEIIAVARKACGSPHPNSSSDGYYSCCGYTIERAIRARGED